MTMAGPVTPVDFTDFELSAKIDFLTLETSAEFALPPLDGKAVWPKQEHRTVLTVHDPSPADIARLADARGTGSLIKVEVSVDVRPKFASTRAACDEALERAYYQLIAGLAPSGRALKPKDRFMALHNPNTGRPVPFNNRRPPGTWTAYWGHRSDDAQVKLYVKRADQGAELTWRTFVTRLEVTLATGGLAQHGLYRVGDLTRFKFRKELSPYFRLTRGVRRRRERRERKHSILPFIRSTHDKCDAAKWKLLGAPAFIREAGRVFSRDSLANEVIGDALARLEKRMASSRKSGSQTPPPPLKPARALGSQRAAVPAYDIPN